MSLGWHLQRIMTVLTLLKRSKLSKAQEDSRLTRMDAAKAWEEAEAARKTAFRDMVGH